MKYKIRIYFKIIDDRNSILKILESNIPPTNEIDLPGIRMMFGGGDTQVWMSSQNGFEFRISAKTQNRQRWSKPENAIKCRKALIEGLKKITKNPLLITNNICHIN